MIESIWLEPLGVLPTKPLSGLACAIAGTINARAATAVMMVRTFMSSSFLFDRSGVAITVQRG
jgi:hypothetical protein